MGAVLGFILEMNKSCSCLFCFLFFCCCCCCCCLFFFVFFCPGGEYVLFLVSSWRRIGPALLFILEVNRSCSWFHPRSE